MVHERRWKRPYLPRGGISWRQRLLMNLSTMTPGLITFDWKNKLAKLMLHERFMNEPL